MTSLSPSLNATVSEDGEGEWEPMLVDQSPNAEAVVANEDERVWQAEALRSALNMLNERERFVFEARRLCEDPPSLEQLGHQLHISAERVRQIEVSAFGKVKRAVRSHCRHLES